MKLRKYFNKQFDEMEKQQWYKEAYQRDIDDFKILSDFATKIAESQQDLDPEIRKALKNRFWDLL